MSLVLSEDTMNEPPEAAHAASEIDDDIEEVCPLVTGLIWAAVLTLGCLLAAHVIVRWWP